MFRPTNAQKWFDKNYPRKKKGDTKDINISNKTFNTPLKLEGFAKAKNINLKKLKLDNLEISNCSELTDINFNNCSIKSLTVSDCPKLIKLDCSNIGLTELEIVDCLILSDLKYLNNSIEDKNLNINLCPQLNYSRENVKIENIRNILVVGRTGGGKSTLSNVLCGTDEFEESGYSVSETKDFRQKIFPYNGNNYRVVDTIGIGDTKLTKKKVLYKIAIGIYSMPEGISQVLFVVNRRFTKEEIETYKLFKNAIFESGIVGHVTIVRTNFNNFQDKDECEKDKEKLLKENEEIAEILGSCRFVHVDNPPTNLVRNDDDKEINRISKNTRKKSRNMLLKHLEEVCKENYKLKKWDNLREDIAPHMEKIGSEDLVTEKVERSLPRRFREALKKANCFS